MQNVELKLELRDPQLARLILGTLGALRVEAFRQIDTYFRLADGRLKKREFVGEVTGGGGGGGANGEKGPTHATEWIFYHRDNQARQRLSHFRIYSQAEARAFFGSTEPPVWLIVKKSREVYMAGPGHTVRVHLDEVEGLGKFLEFEALVTPEMTLVKAHKAVEELHRALAMALGEAVSMSYSDLLAAELDRAGGEPRMLPGPAGPVG